MATFLNTGVAHAIITMMDGMVIRAEIREVSIERFDSLIRVRFEGYLVEGSSIEPPRDIVVLYADPKFSKGAKPKTVDVLHTGSALKLIQLLTAAILSSEDEMLTISDKHFDAAEQMSLVPTVGDDKQVTLIAEPR